MKDPVGSRNSNEQGKSRTGSGTGTNPSRMLLAVSLLVLVLSLIPLLYLSYADFASGDDMNYGAAAHQAWIQAHSFPVLLSAVKDHVVSVWHGWQGTWFTVALFQLHPEVFAFNTYWVVPWLCLGMQAAAILLFLHHFLVVRLHFDRAQWLTAFCVLFFVLVQFTPNPKYSIYWWNGTIHYMVPFCLCLTAVVCADRFIKAGEGSFEELSDISLQETKISPQYRAERNWRIRDDASRSFTGSVSKAPNRKNSRIPDLVWLTLLQACLGGCSYPAAILAPYAILVLVVMDWLRQIRRNPEDVPSNIAGHDSIHDSNFAGAKCHKETNAASRKIWLRSVFPLLLPLAAELIGLVISMKAPGNKVRGGSDFGFGFGRALGTIASCFPHAFRNIALHLRERPLAFILVITCCLLLIFLRTRRVSVLTRTHSLLHPVLLSAALLLGYIMIFAPEIYSGVEVSNGVYDTYFYVLMFVTGGLTLTWGLLICNRWVHKYTKEDGPVAKKTAEREEISGAEVAPSSVDSSISPASADDSEKTAARFTDRIFRVETQNAHIRGGIPHPEQILVSLALAACLLCLVFACRHTLKSTTLITVLDYIRSGAAADYYDQMQLQYQLLTDDSVSDVVLPMVNDIQGPFMQMPVTDDPGSYTSTTTARYYGKDTVIAIPREQWMQLYGPQ